MIKHLLFLALIGITCGQKQGIWVTRFALKNDQTLQNLVTFAKTNKITDVFLQVRGRGDAYYDSDVEQNIKIKSDLPLTDIIQKLKKENITVHAWINVFLLASSQEIVKREKHHILNANPNWIDFKNTLQSFSKRLETTEDLKRNSNLEGIYTLPIFNDVLQYYQRITSELINKYQFDGIHLDYFRLAGKNYGYHPKMRRLFNTKNNMYIESYMEKSKVKPEIEELWSNFVSSSFTQFLSSLSSKNRDKIWSVAVKPNPYEAKYDYGQDWVKWIETDIVDFVLPMNYTASDYRFGHNINFYKSELIKDKIWVGIATFNQKKSGILSKINMVKQENMSFTLFSFNDLNDKSIKTILR